MFPTSGRRERMSNVDQAWLRMERSTNLMAVVVVVALERRLKSDRFKQILAERFISYRRFRQRVVRQVNQAYWEDDPEFDLDRHVHRVALPGPRKRAELQALVSDLASTALDPAGPLWQFHLVEAYAGGSVVVARIHHCYADGIALVRVLLEMADPESPAQRVAARRRAPADEEPDLWSRLFEPMTEALAGLYRGGGLLWEQYLKLLAHPTQAIDLLYKSIDVAAEAAKLTLMPQDPRTSLKGELGSAKRAAWCERLPLAEAKAIGRLFGCSINDVLLWCVTGALRAYLLEQDDEIEGVEIRALVPVNLRPPEQSESLGNHFGLVFMSLPVGVGDPLQRLQLVRARMTELKHSSQPVLAWGILNAMGMGPDALEQQVLDSLSRNASLVMTNVPGPREPISFAGVRVKELIFWVPQSGDIGVGVSIVSYMGGVQMGLLCDQRRIADPDRVVKRFGAELENLTLLSLMLPWSEPPPEAAPGPGE